MTVIWHSQKKDLNRVTSVVKSSKLKFFDLDGYKPQSEILAQIQNDGNFVNR